MSDQNFWENHEKCFLCRISRGIEWCHPFCSKWPKSSLKSRKLISRFVQGLFSTISWMFSRIFEKSYRWWYLSWNSNTISTQKYIHKLPGHDATWIWSQWRNSNNICKKICLRLRGWNRRWLTPLDFLNKFTPIWYFSFFKFLSKFSFLGFSPEINVTLLFNCWNTPFAYEVYTIFLF